MPKNDPSTDPLVGTHVGPYFIKRRIDAGAMGKVYEAKQKTPPRLVALKIMRPGADHKRFIYESQTLARLRHPGIAQVYEAGTHHSDAGLVVPYFAMEYVPSAKSITEYAKQWKLSVSDRLQMFVKVCDAMSHTHQTGIIHRDIKPSNVIVDGSGQPKIIDFGLASAVDWEEHAELAGTVQYMSPEQLDGDLHDLDLRTDVYSMGLVLYELLVGRLPYHVGRLSLEEAKRVIRETDPTPPSVAQPNLGIDVDAIVLKALEKRRDQRYRWAFDFGDVLRPLIDGTQPEKASPTGTLPPTVVGGARTIGELLAGIFDWHRILWHVKLWHLVVGLLAVVWVLAASALPTVVKIAGTGGILEYPWLFLMFCFVPPFYVMRLWRPGLATRKSLLALISMAIGGAGFAVLAGVTAFYIGGGLSDAVSATWGITFWWLFLGVLWLVATCLIIWFCRPIPKEVFIQRVAGLLTLCAFIAAALLFFLSSEHFPPLLFLGVGLAALGPALLAAILARLRRGWYAERRQHCEACGYLVCAVPGADRCPECGASWRGVVDAASSG